MLRPTPALRHRIDLLTGLVARDLKVRYRGSWLGVAWGLVTPLAQVLVLVLVFRGVVRLHVPQYASYVFSGVLAWNWLQTSLFSATSSLLDSRGLLRRPGFPAPVLPAAAVAGQLVHYLLALPILLLLLSYEGEGAHASWLLLPLLLAIQFCLTTGLAFLLAVAQVVFRDTQQLLSLALMLLFYLTPVFYDASAVPPAYRALYGLNPLVHLLDAHRAILLRGRMPEPSSLFVLALGSLAFLGLGYWVLRRARYRLVEEL